MVLFGGRCLVNDWVVLFFDENWMVLLLANGPAPLGIGRGATPCYLFSGKNNVGDRLILKVELKTVLKISVGMSDSVIPDNS